MYYLYTKSNSSALPMFDYTFKNFKEFYDLAPLLSVPVIGTYNIRIKSEDYKDIIAFISNQDAYVLMTVYLEIPDTLLSYISLYKPDICVLESKSNFDIFKELITTHGILFDKKCISIMYNSIPHSYSEMNEALELVKTTYPDKKPVTVGDLEKLFVIENIIYPRQVLIAYLRKDRGRQNKLQKCINFFGNDLVLYAMRKSVRQLLKDKIKYLKTGQGSKMIKMLSHENILRMCMALDYQRSGFKDITTILNMYERGEYINDYLQERTYSGSNEKHYAP